MKLESNHIQFTRKMQGLLMRNEAPSRVVARRLAEKDFGIKDEAITKELIEYAIVKAARTLHNTSKTQKAAYDKIVDLYKNQTNLTLRTSKSMMLQQYSTPAPIGYLAGLYCKKRINDTIEGWLFEPSAGTGLLTVAWEPKHAVVNELDEVRNAILKDQGFLKVFQEDATEDFDMGNHRSFFQQMAFDALITNPPFGTLPEPKTVDGFKIKHLDHWMAINGLDQLAPKGKAAIIIGGHTDWDSKGRVQSGKNRLFLNYLYKHYNVDDVINIDGHALYSRQGTAFNTRLILINGRKAKPEGFSPLKNSRDVVVKSFEALYDRVSQYFPKTKDEQAMREQRKLEMEAEALQMELELGLAGPYFPGSDSCNVLDTITPDSMDFEVHQAVERVKRAVGGSLDDYVQKKLGYKSHIDLCRALAAEQIDAVGLAIYNIEERSQALIIGDQTGIGKGRQAAALLRYGVKNGYKPIFLTEKPNLFSDLYRDLIDIGSGDLVPFIVNGRESKTDIKNKDGEVIHQALPKAQQDSVLKSQKLPSNYDFIVATYSQFNQPIAKPLKPMFLSKMAKNNVFIMDESHNASGSSNTGEFLQSVIRSAKGALFLSATFAKRPDNMPLYALKTAMTDANMTPDDLVEAIMGGGVALQEIIASQLVYEGQMIRRERSFEGVEVNYKTLDQLANEHSAIADSMTEIIRLIIEFQADHISPVVEGLDKIAAAEGQEVEARKGTKGAGVDNQPYFSRVFNVINQMLFSVKANAIADRTIERLKEGKKPVIAFSNTMGSFLEDMGVENGDTIDVDFSYVLQKGLESVMKITTTDVMGDKDKGAINLNELSEEGRNFYAYIVSKIKNVSSGITISPIDVIKQRITQEGFRVAEVTGRKLELQLNKAGDQAVVLKRKKEPTNDAFMRFNNNEVDVLMINQSGSTGASAHAVPTPKVSKEEVKQRVMIVLQAELDINREVQKRGRINRTGQIIKPIYDYMTSAIPAEQRLMMMLQKKLKSLDANTSSNQKQSSSVLDVPDFLNKYGDKVVVEYLQENPTINTLLGDPLNFGDSDKPEKPEGASNKVSGRVAILPVKDQKAFYEDITERYNDLVEYLKQTDEYDLEVETLDLKAETLKSFNVIMGKSANSVFGASSVLEEVEVNALKKPFKRVEIDNMLEQTLEGVSPKDYQQSLLNRMAEFSENRLSEKQNEINDKYDNLINNITSEKGYINANEGEKVLYLSERKQQLNEARAKQLERWGNKIKGDIREVRTFLQFFYPGRFCLYPTKSFEGARNNVPAIFLGVQINENKSNPFAPSALKFRFAIADSTKYIAFPASGEFGQELRAIMGVSYSVRNTFEFSLDNWDNLIKESSKDRVKRYIVTGNILQAFEKYSGSLIDYTRLDGTTNKGILMPNNWEPQLTGQKVQIPILKAFPIINGLSSGQSIMTTDNKLAIARQPNFFKLYLNGDSKKKVGHIFLNEDLQSLTLEGKFTSIGGRMTASVKDDNLNALIKLLDKDFSMAVEISQTQFDSIKDSFEQFQEREVLEVSKINKQEEKEKQRLELEAEALAIELDLLSFKTAA